MASATRDVKSDCRTKWLLYSCTFGTTPAAAHGCSQVKVIQLFSSCSGGIYSFSIRPGAVSISSANTRQPPPDCFRLLSVNRHTWCASKDDCMETKIKQHDRRAIRHTIIQRASRQVCKVVVAVINTADTALLKCALSALLMWREPGTRSSGLEALLCSDAVSHAR